MPAAVRRLTLSSPFGRRHLRQSPRIAALFQAMHSDGKIVEHWNVLQPVPTASRTRTRCSDIGSMAHEGDFYAPKAE